MKYFVEDKSSYNRVFLTFYFTTLFFSLYICPIFCILRKYSDNTKNKLMWLGGLLGLLTELSIISIGRGVFYITSNQWFGYLLLGIGVLLAISMIVITIKIANKNKLKTEFRLSKSHVKKDLAAYFVKYGVKIDSLELDNISKKLDLSTMWDCATDFSGYSFENFYSRTYNNKDLSILLDYIPTEVPTLEQYKDRLLLNVHNISRIVKDNKNIITKLVTPEIDTITEEVIESLIKNEILYYSKNYSYRYNYEQIALGIIIGTLGNDTNKSTKKLLKKVNEYAKINGYTRIE